LRKNEQKRLCLTPAWVDYDLMRVKVEENDFNPYYATYYGAVEYNDNLKRYEAHGQGYINITPKIDK
jgi:hypothetical protein